MSLLGVPHISAMLLRIREIIGAVMLMELEIGFLCVVYTGACVRVAGEPRSRAAIKSLAFSSRVGSPTLVDVSCHKSCED